MRIIKFLIVWVLFIFLWHLGSNIGERAFTWVIENFTDLEILQGIYWIFTALIIGGLTAFAAWQTTKAKAN